MAPMSEIFDRPTHTGAGPFRHGSRGAAVSGRTGTYRSWKYMRRRCNNPNATGYRYYGGRGISVCPEWDDFAVFLADLGPRPDGYSLDRLDPDGDYEPANCQWFPLDDNRRKRRNRSS